MEIEKENLTFPGLQKTEELLLEYDYFCYSSHGKMLQWK
jgi:hypothetical protein